MKLRTPPLRDHALPRPVLVERLAQARQSVCLVVAPAGYGKTTLLAQLARSIPDVAWIRLDETDDDPTVLLSDMVDAIDTVVPLDAAIRQAVTTPAELSGFAAPGRFVDAMGDLPRTLTLVLDDAHLVASATARDWLTWVLERAPARLRFVIAARRDPDLMLGRLAASGELLELGPADLALDADEIRRLGTAVGVDLAATDVAGLLTRSEGWPLAIHLSLSSRTSTGDVGGVGGRAGEAEIMGFLRSELLGRMEPAARDWVLRSSVLDEMSGPLCDAAMETTGSLRMLRSLERDNQLVIPLDPLRTSYRYHVLYRDLMRTELEAHLPGERARVAARGAAWLAQQGRLVEAGHLLASCGTLDDLAKHVERYSLAIFWSGGLATVRGWIARFDRDGIRERHARVAVIGAWAEALMGNLAPASHWLAAAQTCSDRQAPFDGSADIGAWLATLRAILMADGTEGLDADIERARATLAPVSPFMSSLRIAMVVRELVAGRLDAADALAREAEELQRARGALPGLTTTLGLRAVIAVDRTDAEAATRHVRDGQAIVEQSGLEEYVTSALLHAVGARLAAQRGDRATCSTLLGQVNRMRPLLTAVMPWYALYVRLQAIRAAIIVREPGTARSLLGEIDDVLRARPRMGALLAEVERVRTVVVGLRGAEPGPWTLTTAELRVLAYLPTHLTFREIAERLFLSPHTIKTQAMSTYAKLEANSRREAIERAVAVGLLDPSVLHQAVGAATIA